MDNICLERRCDSGFCGLAGEGTRLGDTTASGLEGEGRLAGSGRRRVGVFDHLVDTAIGKYLEYRMIMDSDYNSSVLAMEFLEV